MKTKYFFSAAACAAMAFIFFACSSDDSGDIAGGSSLSDLPKQVYFVETDYDYDNGNFIMLKKEDYIIFQNLEKLPELRFILVLTIAEQSTT